MPHIFRTCLNPTCQKKFPVETCRIKKGRSTYCTIQCYRNDRSRFVEKRFWAKVEKSVDPDGCWLWTATHNAKGYGQFVVTTNVWMPAHRFAYATYVGPIPEGMLICHHCDHPSCVRPDHLFAGTPQDNAQDAVKKGRAVNPGAHNAKLTESDVRYIRTMKGQKTAVVLSKEIGVSPVTISDAWRYKTYRNIR